MRAADLVLERRGEGVAFAGSSTLSVVPLGWKGLAVL